MHCSQCKPFGHILLSVSYFISFLVFLCCDRPYARCLYKIFIGDACLMYMRLFLQYNTYGFLYTAVFIYRHFNDMSVHLGPISCHMKTLFCHCLWCAIFESCIALLLAFQCTMFAIRPQFRRTAVGKSLLAKSVISMFTLVASTS